MLERLQRVTTDRDHRKVWQAGRVSRGRALVLRYISTGLPSARFGFVVSTAVAKKATIRNLLKRRLRAIARQAVPDRSYDIVVYATKAATKTTYADLKKEFLDIVHNIHAPTPTRHN